MEENDPLRDLRPSALGMECDDDDDIFVDLLQGLQKVKFWELPEQNFLWPISFLLSNRHHQIYVIQ